MRTAPWNPSSNFAAAVEVVEVVVAVAGLTQKQTLYVKMTGVGDAENWKKRKKNEMMNFFYPRN